MIDVDMRKWRDDPHWRFAGTKLGTDEFGTWIAAPPGTAFTGPAGAGNWLHGFVALVPHEGWWAALWNEPGAGRIESYVDITTPALWLSDEHVQCVDLDLDVARYWDGRVAVLDEDEFEQHRVERSYPPDICDGALESCRLIHEAVAERAEPFGAASAPWLKALADLGDGYRRLRT